MNYTNPYSFYQQWIDCISGKRRAAVVEEGLAWLLLSYALMQQDTLSYGLKHFFSVEFCLGIHEGSINFFEFNRTCSFHENTSHRQSIQHRFYFCRCSPMMTRVLGSKVIKSSSMFIHLIRDHKNKNSTD